MTLWEKNENPTLISGVKLSFSFSCWHSGSPWFLQWILIPSNLYIRSNLMADWMNVILFCCVDIIEVNLSRNKSVKKKVIFIVENVHSCSISTTQDTDDIKQFYIIFDAHLHKIKINLTNEIKCYLSHFVFCSYLTFRETKIFPIDLLLFVQG